MVLSVLGGRTRKERLVLAAVVSFVLCVLLGLYFHHFDSAHWAFTVSSIESGNGVYGLNGFYYPPLYGYMLSFLGLVADMLGIPMVAVSPMDVGETLVTKYAFYDPWFPVMYKAVDALASVAVGYFIYRLVEDYTGDAEKAYRMAMIWYICPIVIQMIGVQGQFDVLAILFCIMCIYSLRKGRFFLAGSLFALSVLTKVFMGPCIISLVLYIWLRYKGQGAPLRYILISAMGALLVVAVAYAPLVIDGTWQYTLTFFTDRAGRTLLMTLATLAGVIPMLGMMVICVYHMYRADPGDADRLLLVWTALLFGTAIAMAPGYQYAPWCALCIILLWTVMDDKRLYRQLYWGAAMASSVTAIVITHFYQMWMGSYYWGFPDISVIIDLTQTFEPAMAVVATVTGTLYAAILALMLLLTLASLFEGRSERVDRLADRIRSLGGGA